MSVLLLLLLLSLLLLLLFHVKLSILSCVGRNTQVISFSTAPILGAFEGTPCGSPVIPLQSSNP